MSLISIYTDTAGQVTVNPRRVKVVCTDSLATVTTAGYLNSAAAEGFTILPTDVLDIIYSFSNGSGTYGVFVPSISNGQITLTAWADTSIVTLPVVSNDFASFSGVTGQLADAGYSPSDATKTKVVMASGAVTSGNIAVYGDTAGTVGQSTAILATNVVSKAAANTFTGVGSIILPKVNGTESGNAVTASGVAGVITTSSLSTAGGSSYAITWTNTVMTATSVVLLTISGGTNTTENITLKIAPGAGTGTLTIYNNTAATGLNGTILISYLIM